MKRQKSIFWKIQSQLRQMQLLFHHRTIHLLQKSLLKIQRCGLWLQINEDI